MLKTVDNPEVENGTKQKQTTQSWLPQFFGFLLGAFFCAAASFLIINFWSAITSVIPIQVQFLILATVVGGLLGILFSRVSASKNHLPNQNAADVSPITSLANGGVESGLSNDLSSEMNNLNAHNDYDNYNHSIIRIYEDEEDENRTFIDVESSFIFPDEAHQEVQSPNVNNRLPIYERNHGYAGALPTNTHPPARGVQQTRLASKPPPPPPPPPPSMGNDFRINSERPRQGETNFLNQIQSANLKPKDTIIVSTPKEQGLQHHQNVVDLLKTASKMNRLRDVNNSTTLNDSRSDWSSSSSPAVPERQAKLNSGTPRHKQATPSSPVQHRQFIVRQRIFARSPSVIQPVNTDNNTVTNSPLDTSFKQVLSFFSTNESTHPTRSTPPGTASPASPPPADRNLNRSFAKPGTVSSILSKFNNKASY